MRRRCPWPPRWRPRPGVGRSLERPHPVGVTDAELLIGEGCPADFFHGTRLGTALAAAATGRHSISIERETSFGPLFAAQLGHAPTLAATRSQRRLDDHQSLV